MTGIGRRDKPARLAIDAIPKLRLSRKHISCWQLLNFVGKRYDREELKTRLDSCLLTDEEMSMKPEDWRKWFEELENQEEITGKIPATEAAS